MARDEAHVTNYLAQQVIEAAGKLPDAAKSTDFRQPSHRGLIFESLIRLIATAFPESLSDHRARSASRLILF